MNLRAKLSLLLAIVSTLSQSWAAPPTAEEALSLSPVQQTVTYQRVSAEEQKRCTVRDIDSETWSGWEVRSGDGLTLRVFADTNADKKVDLWCYYQGGIEVYRDIDVNFNGKADQYRWLGTNGSRWGLDQDEDGTIDRWKSISAEEVSSELIGAVQRMDQQAFDILVASADELDAAGFGANKLERLKANAQNAKDQFLEFAANQKQLDKKARWLQFAASAPGMIPAGTDGSTRDAMIYDNAVALFQSGEVDRLRTGQIYLGALLRVGDNWRLLGLPTFDEEKSLALSGNFFLADNSSDSITTQGAAVMSEMTQDLVSQLEIIDRRLADLSEPSSEVTTDSAIELNKKRADLLEQLISNAVDTPEQESWTMQLIDMLAISAQTAAYPEAAQRLSKLTENLQATKSSMQAYASFQSITTDYLVSQLSNQDFETVQSEYIESLRDFVKIYPQSPQAAKAWIQIALQNEFIGDEAEAASTYRKIVERFPNSDQAEIAQGAVRRLESIGKRLDLRGKTIEGESFQLSKLRGKLIVIHYWATWCSPCLQDIKALAQMRISYPDSAFELVGINVDVAAERPRQYLQKSPIPWVQLFEPGGLEGSGLSKALGIQTLPAMILIDEDGKLINNNLQISTLRDELTRRFP